MSDKHVSRVAQLELMYKLAIMSNDSRVYRKWYVLIGDKDEDYFRPDFNAIAADDKWYKKVCKSFYRCGNRNSGWQYH